MRKGLPISLVFALASVMPMSAQQVAEKLNRAPVAVMTSQGVLVSWRSLDSDGSTSFSVYRNGNLLKSGIADVTNYLDADGNAGDTYKIVGSNGEESTTKAWDNMFTSFDVTRPSSIKSGSTTGRYRPDDMSVGDLDGDGDYELVLKWMPDNARDNGDSGYSSPCILSAYEMDGTPLWSQNINLGLNIRSGNHYTQFLVYDFDGDGKAEIICKTAPGSKDAKGNYVTAAGDATIQAIDNSASYVNSSGHVTDGEELLTVFNGQTGAAMNTIWYSPSRSAEDFATKATTYNTSAWEDKNNNRGNRHNAAVAYLDGPDKLPSAIMQRGYYTRCYIWAVDWDGTSLKTRWLHCGLKGSWKTVDAADNTLLSGSGSSSYGQGVHSISIGDVNADGCDEIVIGSATIGHDGSLLCSTGLGHGDAIHLIPSSQGYLVMMPHEDSPYGYDVHDATTGDFLVHVTGSSDNGRGLAADLVPSNAGHEFWSSADSYTYSCADGSQVLAKKADTNFRIYWTGDPYDQTFDGRYDSNTKASAPRIRSYNTSSKGLLTFQEFADYGSPSSCNTTKATPCLQADILGDWREEIIMYESETDYTSPTCKILIYSTPEPTKYKVPCLMQDHIYRMGIAWQNSAYNQPPHLGYELPKSLGIDGSTYVTQTTSHAPTAPKAVEKTEGEEIVVAAKEDKAAYSGICYSANGNGEITASTSGSYVKMRTNNNDAIVLTVNSGYEITGIKIEAYSNNSSTAADRSIDLTGIYVDDATSSVLANTVTFPGGTAGKTPTTASASGFTASSSIKLTFDNSLITTSDVDAAGKNKQIFAIITLTWKKAATDGIESITYQPSSITQMYNIQGQRISSPKAGDIYIMNGKKYIFK